MAGVVDDSVRWIAATVHAWQTIPIVVLGILVVLFIGLVVYLWGVVIRRR